MGTRSGLVHGLGRVRLVTSEKAAAPCPEVEPAGTKNGARTNQDGHSNRNRNGAGCPTLLQIQGLFFYANILLQKNNIMANTGARHQTRRGAGDERWEVVDTSYQNYFCS